MSLRNDSMPSSIQEPRYSWPRSAVIRMGRVSYHPGRSFPSAPDTLQRYLVGRQYWRILSYLQGMWPSLSNFERIPHLLVTGVSGCGKSWTFAAAASFLRQPRLSPTHRAIYVSDCAVWLNSSDALSFFCMETMTALQNDLSSDLSMVKSRLVSRSEELCPWLQIIDDWLGKSGLKIIVLLDQIESLQGKPDCLPNIIIKALLNMKHTIVVMSLTVDGPTMQIAPFNWNFLPAGIHQMHFNYSIPSSDYSHLSDLIFGSSLSLHEGSLLREVRLYTGGVIRELVACLTFGMDLSSSSVSSKTPFLMTGVELTTRVEGYRRATIDKVIQKVEGTVGQLDRIQRIAFLFLVFRMVLHLPEDVVSLINFPSELRSLFLPGVLQKFYHPREFIAVVLHVPTAVSHTVHLAISSPRLLFALADRPWVVMHKLASSILDSNVVCSESKRRLIRFYAIHRLSCLFPLKVAGLSDFERQIEIDTGPSFVVHHFAGLTPSKDILAWLIAQSIVLGNKSRKDAKNSSQYSLDVRPDVTLSEMANASPVVLIPGRTDYCFFDFFLFDPVLRRLFAVSTIASPVDWKKGKGNTGSLPTSTKSVSEGLISPVSLIELWKRVLRDVLPFKFSIHCVSVKPNDLLLATDYPGRLPDC